MNSLIHIEVSNQLNFYYRKGFISEVKAAVHELEIFDLDNHSDASLYTYAADLLRMSDKCVMLFTVEQDAALGKIMFLLEEVLKNKEKCYVLVQGKHPMMERIAHQIPQMEWVDDFSLSLDLIIRYLKSGGNAK